MERVCNKEIRMNDVGKSVFNESAELYRQIKVIQIFLLICHFGINRGAQLLFLRSIAENVCLFLCWVENVCTKIIFFDGLFRLLCQFSIILRLTEKNRV